MKPLLGWGPGPGPVKTLDEICEWRRSGPGTASVATAIAVPVPAPRRSDASHTSVSSAITDTITEDGDAALTAAAACMLRACLLGWHASLDFVFNKQLRVCPFSQPFLNCSQHVVPLGFCVAEDASGQQPVEALVDLRRPHHYASSRCLAVTLQCYPLPKTWTLTLTTSKSDLRNSFC